MKPEYDPENPTPIDLLLQGHNEYDAMVGEQRDRSLEADTQKPRQPQVGSDDLVVPLPCPFCGQLPELTKHFRHDDFGLIHRCKVIGAIAFEFAPKARQIARWNTRHNTELTHPEPKP